MGEQVVLLKVLKCTTCCTGRDFRMRISTNDSAYHRIEKCCIRETFYCGQCAVAVWQMQKLAWNIWGEVHRLHDKWQNETETIQKKELIGGNAGC